MAINVENSHKKAKFRIKCEYCLCEFTYESEDLGFRPWYPKGFVYCPECRKPLRHDPVKYVIKENEEVIDAEVLLQ